MGEYAKIGAYQLGNVIRNQTKFTYLDLRTDAGRSADPLPPELLAGAEPATVETALERARELSAKLDGALGSAHERPVILLCDSGVESARAALKLAEAGFVNVFVIDGGAAGLI